MNEAAPTEADGPCKLPSGWAWGVATEVVESLEAALASFRSVAAKLTGA
jgi:hypothetical protein